MERTVESVLADLKKDRFRLTEARKAVVAAALEAGAPVSAQDVAAALKERSVSANVTTVYRELEFLCERGVLAPVSFTDGVRRYESATLGHHHHLICLGCKKVEDVVVPHGEVHRAERAIEKERGFAVLRHALEFYGTCAACR